jgi:hypothetical protein
VDLTPSGDEVRPEQESQPPVEPIETTPTGLPGEPSEPAEAEAWESFVDPETQGGESVPEERTFVMAPEEDTPWGFEPPAPPAAPRRGGWLMSILLIVLAVGLVAATGFGVWQYRQGVMTRNAAQQAVALIGTGLPQELTARANDIQVDLLAGHSDLATQKIIELGATLDQLKTQAQQPGGTPGAGGAAPLPPGAYDDLPGDARTFFQQHEDMYRRFLEMCAIARDLKEKGANVDELRRMRDAVIEAARLGQVETVEKKMAVMVEQLKEQTGGGRGPLAEKARKVEQAARRAEAQGRDVRPVVALMRKTEEAAAAGNLEQAEKYLDQAMEAVKRAPRVRRDGRPGFVLRPGGVRQNPLLPFVQTLLGVMGTEEENLKVVMDQLVAIRGVLVGDKPADATVPAPQPDAKQIETLQPMAERALAELQTVAQRRQELAAAMPGKPGGKQLDRRIGPRQGPTPEEREGMIARVAERLGTVLDRVRNLSETDYCQQKGALVGEIMRTVLRPPEPTPPAPAPTALPKDPEQRVRAKMLEASPVLKQWELAGKDTEAVEALFAEARKALYDKKFDVAEQKVDEARKLLGMDQPPPAEGAAAPPPPTLTPPVDPTIKLDLRGN